MESITLVSVDNKIVPVDNNIVLSIPAPISTHDVNPNQLPLHSKLLAAGLAACIGDLCTFPLDTAKARLQVQGESVARGTAGGASAAYRGVFGTLYTISRTEGPKALYNGIVAGLHRQMAAASVRIGLYDTVKQMYQQKLNAQSGSAEVGVKMLAGTTTGILAVCICQPTDVVKVRLQVQKAGEARYTGTLAAYKSIASNEGVRGLWKGSSANIARMAIVNTCELVTYDLIKEKILASRILSDNMPCHFVSAFGAGFVTTVVASPVDVIKTRFMNSQQGAYEGIVHCASKMFREEGPSAFYKGFMPSFLRLGSWNIVMFVCYEQLKRAFTTPKPATIPVLDIAVQNAHQV